MKVVALCVAVLCAAVAVSASGVLAPELESFLESGAHTDAEIDAMAQAELATMLDDASEAEEDASAEAQAEAESEMDMPRDTKQQAAVERAKARAAAAAAAAARPPVPPPKGPDAVQSALAGVPGGDDIIRLVYDELTRLGSVAAAPAAAVTGAPASSPLGISDPRIRTLESRLSEMERVRAAAVAKQKDATISALTSRLAGLDKTLTELKKSSAQQKKLTDRLLAVAKSKEAKADAGTPVDYSVSYEKATLPADFESQVAAILKSVKTEARKIYEKRCRTCKRKAKRSATPKKYPSEGKPAAAGAAAPAPAAAAAPKGKGPSMNAQPPAAEEEEQPKAKNTAVLKSGKPKKLLFSPIVTGKEPTPEGMRLSKALNDISIALPVTPAYQLSSKEKALHDVLGESAVSDKFKTPRL